MQPPHLSRFRVAVMIAVAAAVLGAATPRAEQQDPVKLPERFDNLAPQGNQFSDPEPVDRQHALTQTFTSGNLALAIPDNTTVNSTIGVGTHAGAIVDVNLRIRLDHTFLADLDIALIAPDGTAVQVVTDVGGGSDDFGAGNTNCSGTFTTFDDQATQFIEAGTAPYLGTFRGENNLSEFNGGLASGTWTLRITDDATSDVGTLYCWQLTIRRAVAPLDFSIDGKSELWVWRPGATGTVFARTLDAVLGSAPVGTTGDIPVPAAYVAGSTDQFSAVFRPSTGQWINTGVATFTFGINGDVPVPGDYNGDGTADVAVWRPTDGTWYLRGITNIAWGAPGDIPVPADYDGDGVTDLAVWRPSNGIWFIRNVANLAWGTAGDIAVPGDYNGDGKAELAIFRPTNGTWYITTVDTQNISVIPWGTNGDIPVPADYDGDGKTDIAIFRGSDGGWYMRNVGVIPWGTVGDIPLTKRPTYPGYPF